jgi:endonuclease-3
MKRKLLTEMVDRLLTMYGRREPPPLTDPFELVLYENVSYLVDDDHRAKAFANLHNTIGLKPEDILTALPEQFDSVVALAGSHKNGRVGKLIAAAQIATNDFNGDVSRVLKLPYKKALAGLRKFPSIGGPGAEKILLHCGIAASLPLESNGLRVLLRVGYGNESTNFTTTYKSVQSAIADETIKDREWLIDAHYILRHHGQVTCKSKVPLCDRCVLFELCDHRKSLATSAI